MGCIPTKSKSRQIVIDTVKSFDAMAKRIETVELKKIHTLAQQPELPEDAARALSEYIKAEQRRAVAYGDASAMLKTLLSETEDDSATRTQFEARFLRMEPRIRKMLDAACDASQDAAGVVFRKYADAGLTVPQ